MKIIKWITPFLCVFIIIATVMATNQMFFYKNHLSETVPADFINKVHTVDLFDENFAQIRSRANITQQLSEINTLFHQNDYFDFLEISLSNIYMENKNDKENPLKYEAAHFGKGVMDYFSLKTENNNSFKDSDFANNPSRIPVILGNGYKSKYQIGDEIELIVNGYDVTGYVIDFMLKDEYIIHFQSRINLNDYFIIPYTEMSPNDGDYSLISRDEYNFRLLLSRNNGLVLPKGSLADAKLETQRISDIYDLPYTLSVSYDEEMTLYNNILLICYPLMILCIVILIIYIVIYVKKIKYRKNNSQNIE